MYLDGMLTRWVKANGTFAIAQQLNNQISNTNCVSWIKKKKKIIRTPNWLTQSNH